MPEHPPDPRSSQAGSNPQSSGAKGRPAWAKAFEKEAAAGAAGAGIPKPRIALYAVILVVGLILWQKMGSSDPPPAKESAASQKARQAGQGAAAVRADSLRAKRDARARAKRAAAAVSDSSGALPHGPLTDFSDDGQAPQDLAAYEFVRTPWESPSAESLAGRVNRLDQGYDRHPMARFHGVQGRSVFLRHSRPVLFVPGRRLDRIPEKAVSEFLPEWYQRGFTVHFRGHHRPFLPMHFKLEDPPGPAAPVDSGQDPLVHYAVHAYVEDEGALLIYPDTERQEGPNGWVAADELRLAEGMAGFGAAYFGRLTGGRVEAVKTFSLPDRDYRLVEVHARRDTPGRSPEDTVRGHKGIYLFAVNPGERKVAFLVHDFDQRFCQEDKDIRFRGVVDVAGDETAEILLGPRPHFLVHEDAEGLKYHFEEGYTCEERPGA